MSYVETPPPIPLNQQADLERLEQENQQLIAQVKQLVRVERSMIEFQDKLDLQVKFYRQLNEIAKRLKATFDPEEILKIAMEFMLYDLNFERCLILSCGDGASQLDRTQLPVVFQAMLWDGYEEDEEPIGCTLHESDWHLLPLFQTQDFVIKLWDMPVLPNLGELLGMDEFILCSIRASATQSPYIIALGNTSDRAKHFTRVLPEADCLVVLSNLLAQVSGAIAQAQLYQSTHHQAETLRTTLEKLQSTQSQLIQTEKMSSLGQLLAGIAHEINNPVNFISGNLVYTHTYATDLLKLVSVYQSVYPETDAAVEDTLEAIDFEFLHRDFPQVIASMQMGASRIQEIVQSLKNFSRIEESDFNAVDLRDGIESTLLILQHRLKADHNRPMIKLIRQYDEALPMVECLPGLINQVLMNLLSNAIDAMESACEEGLIQEPEIRICTAIEGDGVLVSIIDNGIGIPEAVKNKLFDAFFTTKPVGKGTGLGLSISHQIVTEKHGGRLDCISTPGEGTTFRIWLPLKPLVA
jgi:signal transduction histidine kinase